MARRSRSERGPRMSRRTTALVCVAVVAVALFSVLVPVLASVHGIPLALSFILSAALSTAPLLVVSHPRSAIALSSAASFTLPLLVPASLTSEAPWPWSVPVMLAFLLIVGVTTFVHGARMGAFPLVVGAAGSLAALPLRPDVVTSPPVAANVTANLIVAASVALAVYLIAALLAGRQRVAAELTREREHTALEESRRALVEERTRIARELHDVIAHSMSVIQVQASTARYRLPEIGDAAAAEFDDIAATARGSLTEMRRMLGVLRTEDHAAELAPQQRIDDIPDLVDTIRRAGVTVGLEITGSVGDAPSDVQIAVYRIAQEALSNAVRHAPGSPVTIRIQADAAAIGIRVHDAGSLAEAPPGGGYGLRGMRERVELLGGSFAAGPSADGGWEVRATLPLILSTEPPASADDGYAQTQETP